MKSIIFPENSPFLEEKLTGNMTFQLKWLGAGDTQKQHAASSAPSSCLSQTPLWKRKQLKKGGRPISKNVPFQKRVTLFFASNKCRRLLLSGQWALTWQTPIQMREKPLRQQRAPGHDNPNLSRDCLVQSKAQQLPLWPHIVRSAVHAKLFFGALFFVRAADW